MIFKIIVVLKIYPAHIANEHEVQMLLLVMLDGRRIGIKSAFTQQTFFVG